jgi:redox-sensitive bicupin YhaK (pirin superfamily)
MQKKIAHILDGRERQVRKACAVLQLLPHEDFPVVHPFIVLRHLRSAVVRPGAASGIRYHRRRGFIQVTFQVAAAVYHKDRSGREAVISAADDPWMFSGKELGDGEGSSPSLRERGGAFELIQVRLKLPKAHLWTYPENQWAYHDDQPGVLQQEGVHLRLVCGRYDEAAALSSGGVPLVAISGEIEAGKRLQLSAISGYRTLLYLVKGSIRLNCELIQAHQLVVFEKENEEIIFATNEGAQLLYLSAPTIEIIS